ncbi:DUF6587 family protein [Noviherbaspirillum galbum]|uniref:Uncharacterized protein n=1 Tax=Noviherbaspirillum galbum TaxID=2709383 RepID=A0A6B3SGS4_9BURK|nr:DUF6587 family protein [Noviherbaspirillum galbum]NEX59830.1 hypothetical protein [Noviherbaspirillum galbum]
MNLQEWIVGAIVLVAFAAVCRRYLPRTIRQALRSGMVKLATGLSMHGLARRLSAVREEGGSCGDGCGSCGGCGSPAGTDAKDGAQPPARVIPLKMIRH